MLFRLFGGDLLELDELDEALDEYELDDEELLRGELLDRVLLFLIINREDTTLVYVIIEKLDCNYLERFLSS